MKILLIFFLCFLTSVDLAPIELSQGQKTITVEVKGELDNPGLFTLAAPATLNELMDKLQLNDKSYVDHLLLTQPLFDQQVIVIRKKQEKTLISINSATQDELMMLPGIGETLASRIIQYRNEFGGFYNIEDLMNIKGIKKSKFDKLKDLITL